MQSALEKGQFQWVLQLADYLLVLDYNTADVTAAKVSALRGTARQQISAAARNYYFSVARELESGQ